MGEHRLGQPQPEVHHLPTIVRRIRNGELIVPAFQRDFVWSEAQIVDLLESVYRGYPIGSVLLWRTKSSTLKASTSDTIPFPKNGHQEIVHYILDGMQRLSTLYGVLTFGEAHNVAAFDVAFDLVDQRFFSVKGNVQEPTSVRIGALFAPGKLLEAQQKLASLPDATSHMNDLIDLHSKFQEYMVPLVTIVTDDVDEVVRVFERINSTGTKLSTVDFMRAVTWSKDFDLNSAVDSINGRLAEQSFALEDETIVKILAIMLGRDPTPESLLSLRQASSGELTDAIDRAQGVLDRVIDFFNTRLCILSSDYVPYEGNILVVSAVMAQFERLSQENLQTLESWVWHSGFNEGLRGRPDNVVARLIRQAVHAMANTESFLDRSYIMPEEITSRRFTKGGALSAITAAMFAKCGARSLTTNEVIPPQSYMAEFSVGHFRAILRDTLIDAPLRNIANIAVATEAEQILLKRINSRLPVFESIRDRILEASPEALQSQFIDDDALHAFRRGDAIKFLVSRAFAMYRMIEKLTHDPLMDRDD